MADLLFDLLPFAWQETKFKMHDIALANFTEEEVLAVRPWSFWSKFSEKTSQNHALSPTVQVLVALRFFASGSFLHIICDTVSLPKSPICRIIRDMSAALIQKRNEFFRWPTTAVEI